MKTVGATGISATGIGFAGISEFSSTARADPVGPEYDLNTTYEDFNSNTTHLGTGLTRVTTSAEADDYWSHTFNLAGSGCVVDDSGITNEVFSQNMVLKNTTTDHLSVFTSPNQEKTGLYPDPDDHTAGDGAAVVGTATSALSLAATAAGATAGSYALGAATLASGLLNLFSNYLEETTDPDYNRFVFEGGYGSGIGELGHHCMFIVHEAKGERSSDYEQYDMEVRSEAGLAINGWTISFAPRGVYASSTESYEWTKPADMSEAAKEYYGVKKVPKSQVEGRANTSEPVYVAENPPVNTNPLSESRKSEIRAEKQNEN